MRRWVKFNVVGVPGFILQSGALFFLTHTTHCIGYLGATAVAVELAILNNFVWHQRWTWKDRPSSTMRETLRRLAKFNITSGVVSIAGNVGLMILLVGRLDMPIAGANVVSVAACSLFNFVLADRFAFDVDTSAL